MASSKTQQIQLLGDAWQHWKNIQHCAAAAATALGELEASAVGPANRAALALNCALSDACALQLAALQRILGALSTLNEEEPD